MKVFLAAQAVNTCNPSTPGSRLEGLRYGVSLGSVVRTWEKPSDPLVFAHHGAGLYMSGFIHGCRDLNSGPCTCTPNAPLLPTGPLVFLTMYILVLDYWRVPAQSPLPVSCVDSNFSRLDRKGSSWAVVFCCCFLFVLFFCFVFCHIWYLFNIYELWKLLNVNAEGLLHPWCAQIDCEGSSCLTENWD